MTSDGLHGSDYEPTEASNVNRFAPGGPGSPVAHGPGPTGGDRPDGRDEPRSFDSFPGFAAAPVRATAPWGGERPDATPDDRTAPFTADEARGQFMPGTPPRSGPGPAASWPEPDQPGTDLWPARVEAAEPAPNDPARLFAPEPPGWPAPAPDAYPPDAYPPGPGAPDAGAPEAASHLRPSGLPQRTPAGSAAFPPFDPAPPGYPTEAPTPFGVPPGQTTPATEPADPSAQVPAGYRAPHHPPGLTGPPPFGREVTDRAHPDQGFGAPHPDRRAGSGVATASDGGPFDSGPFYGDPVHGDPGYRDQEPGPSGPVPQQRRPEPTSGGFSAVFGATGPAVPDATAAADNADNAGIAAASAAAPPGSRLAPPADLAALPAPEPTVYGSAHAQSTREEPGSPDGAAGFGLGQPPHPGSVVEPGPSDPRPTAGEPADPARRSADFGPPAHAAGHYGPPMGWPGTPPASGPPAPDTPVGPPPHAHPAGPPGPYGGAEPRPYGSDDSPHPVPRAGTTYGSPVGSPPGSPVFDPSAPPGYGHNGQRRPTGDDGSAPHRAAGVVAPFAAPAPPPVPDAWPDPAGYAGQQPGSPPDGTAHFPAFGGPPPSRDWDPGPGAAPRPPGRETAPGGPPGAAADQGYPASAEERAAEPPQVRNGRVLAAVLGVALLLLIIPFGIVWLVTGSDDPAPSFQVGNCVKRQADTAVGVACGTADAFEIVARVDAKEQCPDPRHPVLVQPGEGGRQDVFCLKPG